MIDFEVESELLDTDDFNNTLAIQVEGEPAPPTSYNIATSISGSFLASSGEQVQLVVTFSSSGPERANDVIFESDIPSSLGIVDISSSAAGVTCSLSTATCVGSTIGINESMAATYTLRGINIGTYNLSFSVSQFLSFSVSQLRLQMYFLPMLIPVTTSHPQCWKCWFYGDNAAARLLWYSTTQLSDCFVLDGLARISMVLCQCLAIENVGHA